MCLPLFKGKRSMLVCVCPIIQEKILGAPHILSLSVPTLESYMTVKCACTHTHTHEERTLFPSYTA